MGAPAPRSTLARRGATLAAVLATASLAAAGGGAAGGRQPAPLSGVTLPAGTGLRLLVAARVPFVLDVDSGRARPLAGIPPLRRGVLWVVGVGGRGAVVVAEREWPRQELYGVRGAGARAVPLGEGRALAAAGDGRSVWVLGPARGTRCVLRRVRLDGRVVRAPRPFPCAPIGDPAGGSLGLVANRTRLLDPRTGRVLLSMRFGIVAVAGKALVLAGPGRDLTLRDGTRGTERRLAWPSILGGLDAPAVDPRGRLVALAFADPAWNLGGEQAQDVWVLDTATGRLTQLPGMPAFVSLKFTSMAWTDDGRLVLLARERSGRQLVAVWRPGERRLALKTVRPPDLGSSGSDTFAPVR